MQGVTLITPTSDRPRCFKLCERWMREALPGLSGRDVQWIVADDGDEPVECTLGQLHLRRERAPDPLASFRGNLQAALERARHPIVLFIEDDDWYSPDYLAGMVARFQKDVQIAGESNAVYYHLPTRGYYYCKNTHHASLCQTGIHRSLIPWLLGHLAHCTTPWVDMELWSVGAKDAKRCLDDARRCVGMKGLPGKSGLGYLHDPHALYVQDPAGERLREWIGAGAADAYFSLL